MICIDYGEPGYRQFSSMAADEETYNGGACYELKEPLNCRLTVLKEKHMRLNPEKVITPDTPAGIRLKTNIPFCQ